MLLFVSYLCLTYLLSSVPFGVVLCTFAVDADPRDGGSGNIGATNVYRQFGTRLGLLTLLLDGLKGWLPTALALSLWPATPAFAGAVALTAFAGHCFSAYLGLRGGKGVATAAGVLLALSPWTALLSLLVWAAAVAVWRRASLGALLAAIAMPLLMLWLSPQLWWAGLLLTLGVMLRHRENIDRLRRRVEPTT